MSPVGRKAVYSASFTGMARSWATSSAEASARACTAAKASRTGCQLGCGLRECSGCRAETCLVQSCCGHGRRTTSLSTWRTVPRRFFACSVTECEPTADFLAVPLIVAEPLPAVKCSPAGRRPLIRVIRVSDLDGLRHRGARTGQRTVSGVRSNCVDIQIAGRRRRRQRARQHRHYGRA